uniref:Uncharacterized protein n=1 Tax=Chromera velia CCMP2878 TaxID=1169474 RepID=A0A0G4GMJ2_9ALVE|eukprot:Cvel_22564.t1-p1 / transcript=Cvel_22564.t1 / gene=Cvel_22564 / organism=Chromera_velia_CCMP2878 / gene_product=hypothetical protein / transcript_product=hypothetical protein / location=Cvel_scaffold2229:10729-14043(-) / protein_length=416 / sequence_SO=supercontig / SO=protein_coding / is_pseudo=false
MTLAEAVAFSMYQLKHKEREGGYFKKRTLSVLKGSLKGEVDRKAINFESISQGPVMFDPKRQKICVQKRLIALLWEDGFTFKKTTFGRHMLQAVLWFLDLEIDFLKRGFTKASTLYSVKGGCKSVIGMAMAQRMAEALFELFDNPIWIAKEFSNAPLDIKLELITEILYVANDKQLRAALGIATGKSVFRHAIWLIAELRKEAIYEGASLPSYLREEVVKFEKIAAAATAEKGAGEVAQKLKILPLPGGMHGCLSLDKNSLNATVRLAKNVDVSELSENLSTILRQELEKPQLIDKLKSDTGVKKLCSQAATMAHLCDQYERIGKNVIFSNLQAPQAPPPRPSAALAAAAAASAPPSWKWQQVPPRKESDSEEEEESDGEESDEEEDDKREMAGEQEDQRGAAASLNAPSKQTASQ